jgi:formylglycine-generating enzyme required for sulfatase activity
MRDLVNEAVAIAAPPDFPPAWAGGWGEDVRGVYAELLVRGVAFELRWIPPGSFLMGSPEGEAGRWEAEGPQHLVTLTRGFWLGATVCTQEQWTALMEKNPSQFVGQRKPVENVRWPEALNFTRKLTELARESGSLPPEFEFRLPTEAEWEYACRAGTTTAYNDGSSCIQPDGKDPALERLGWHGEYGKGETHPVGELAANAYGLYDMHGNVWEWCADKWADRYTSEAQTDPTGPGEGARRVVRGGSYWYRARGCRSAFRYGGEPGFSDGNLGFRLAAGQPVESGATGL